MQHPNETEESRAPLPPPEASRAIGSVVTENEASVVEHGFDVPDGIISADDFLAWASDKGYGNGVRGTYHNEDSYLYIKRGFTLKTEEEVEDSLRTVRLLTAKGILHPDTRWGAYKHKKEDEGYQIFPVSPKLTAFSLEEHLGTEHERRFKGTLKDEGSYLVNWFRRLEPDYQPGQEIPKGSLLHYLNVTEAGHTDNWGWDANGNDYPVDVEVIRL